MTGLVGINYVMLDNAVSADVVYINQEGWVL